MNRIARETVALAETLGFTFDGYDGRGHVVLALPDGTRTSIPATPSEYRSQRNQIATLERLSGRKLPRHNHRRSRKASETTDFSLDRARRESTAWHDRWGEQIDALTTERDGLIDRCRTLAREGRRDSLVKLPDLWRRIADIETRLQDDYHQPVEPFDPHSLAGGAA